MDNNDQVMDQSIAILTSEQQSKRDRVVAQHNALIRAQYDMSLLEMRLFVAMLARINRGDREFTTCRIPVSELYSEDKIGGRTYSQVKKAVVRLVSRVITIETKDEQGIREIVSNPLMATCRYKEGTGYVVAQFNNFVKPYLLELKGDFTVAQEMTLIGFRSFYSYRFYWLLKLSAFYRDNIQLDLASVKLMLNLADRYANFADFKRFVLDIAQQEIIFTDMAFEYKPIKEGRTVVGILFHLTRPAVVVQEETELPEGVQQKLTEIGITLKSLHEIKFRFQQKKLSEEYIRFVFQHYEQAKTKGRIRSLAGAIFKALTTDQLLIEFSSWKNEQPVYKAPKSKQSTVAEPTVQTIPLAELESGYEVMRKKGLTSHATFEDSLKAYLADPCYQLNEIDGQQVLIYTEPVND